MHYLWGGGRLNLKNPKTYNEKLNWLKLYNRNPLYTTLVDKFAVKEYISEIIGKEYVVPTIGVWNHFDEIDFNNLPNQFVLKCTHDSSGIVICRDKSKLDMESARRIIVRSLETDYYMLAREWPYKNVPRKIIAEPFLQDQYGELRDYKFFCFNGVVRLMFVVTDRASSTEETKFDFFDADFRHLPVIQGHPNARITINKPNNFDEMKRLAEILSKDIPHVRVDFYEVNNSILFGELTLFHFGGLVPFLPKEWDLKLGEMLTLPN